jgi:hypothetical protein
MQHGTKIRPSLEALCLWLSSIKIP